MFRQSHAARCVKIVLAAVAAAAMAPGSARAEEPEPRKGRRRDIYDTKADGNAQIAAALRKAKADNQRVLLMFGANWCGWCHKLHDLFAADEAIGKLLRYEYQLVLIDVDKLDGDRKHNADVDERYGNPTRQGLPVLVVLDAEGRQLHTQETGALEDGDRHDPAKVLAFLNQWKPTPQSADAMLAASLAAARSSGRKVFVQFSAPWCGWCHRLSDYLSEPTVASVFGKGYVPLKIDVDRMTGAKAIESRYRGESESAGGVPFFVILDDSGRKLADSVSDQGNVGFPVEPFEVAHFVKVLRETSTLGEADVATIEKLLREAGKNRE